MNSYIPHFSNLASEPHRTYLFKFKMSLVRSNKHKMAALCKRYGNYNGEIVQLQSSSDGEQPSNKYHILEPIIRRVLEEFLQKLCSDVLFGAIQLIDSALQRNSATLREGLAPFSLSHVIHSCFFFFPSLAFLILWQLMIDCGISCVFILVITNSHKEKISVVMSSVFSVNTTGSVIKQLLCLLNPHLTPTPRFETGMGGYR